MKKLLLFILTLFVSCTSANEVNNEVTKLQKDNEKMWELVQKQSERAHTAERELNIFLHNNRVPKMVIALDKTKVDSMMYRAGLHVTYEYFYATRNFKGEPKDTAQAIREISAYAQDVLPDIENNLRNVLIKQFLNQINTEDKINYMYNWYLPQMKTSWYNYSHFERHVFQEVLNYTIDYFTNYDYKKAKQYYIEQANIERQEGISNYSSFDYNNNHHPGRKTTARIERLWFKHKILNHKLVLKYLIKLKNDINNF